MAIKRGAGGAGSRKIRQGTSQAAARRAQQQQRTKHAGQLRKRGSNKKGQ